MVAAHSSAKVALLEARWPACASEEIWATRRWCRHTSDHDRGGKNCIHHGVVKTIARSATYTYDTYVIRIRETGPLLCNLRTRRGTWTHMVVVNASCSYTKRANYMDFCLCLATCAITVADNEILGTKNNYTLQGQTNYLIEKVVQTYQLLNIVSNIFMLKIVWFHHISFQIKFRRVSL